MMHIYHQGRYGLPKTEDSANQVNFNKSVEKESTIKISFAKDCNDLMQRSMCSSSLNVRINTETPKFSINSLFPKTMNYFYSHFNIL